MSTAGFASQLLIRRRGSTWRRLWVHDGGRWVPSCPSLKVRLLWPPLPAATAPLPRLCPGHCPLQEEAWPAGSVSGPASAAQAGLSKAAGRPRWPPHEDSVAQHHQGCLSRLHSGCHCALHFGPQDSSEEWRRGQHPGSQVDPGPCVWGLRAAPCPSSSQAIYLGIRAVSFMPGIP